MRKRSKVCCLGASHAARTQSCEGMPKQRNLQATKHWKLVEAAVRNCFHWHKSAIDAPHMAKTRIVPGNFVMAPMMAPTACKSIVGEGVGEGVRLAELLPETVPHVVEDENAAGELGHAEDEDATKAILSLVPTHPARLPPLLRCAGVFLRQFKLGLMGKLQAWENCRQSWRSVPRAVHWRDT